MNSYGNHIRVHTLFNTNRLCTLCIVHCILNCDTELSDMGLLKHYTCMSPLYTCIRYHTSQKRSLACSLYISSTNTLNSGSLRKQEARGKKMQELTSCCTQKTLAIGTRVMLMLMHQMVYWMVHSTSPSSSSPPNPSPHPSPSLSSSSSPNPSSP